MLAAANLEPEVERSSRAEPLEDAEARELLRSVERVVVCRGRKSVEMPASEAEVKDLCGPTGKPRAPLLVAGDTLLVGFNRQAVTDLLAG